MNYSGVIILRIRTPGKTMKVLLINPTLTDEMRYKSFAPPLGLLYIAASLRAHHHQVEFIDCDQELNTLLAIQLKLYEFKPDFIGITTLASTFSASISIARFVKSLKPKTRIVLGGMHASVFPEKLLSCYAEVDYVIVGEGETSFCELIEGLIPLDQIKGLAYRVNGYISLNEPRELSDDLDRIPFPARDLAQKYDYSFRIDVLTLKNIFGQQRTSFATILTSRGCCFRCSYCANSAFHGGSVRYRSAENVLAEIEMLASQGYTKLLFVDDHFTSDVPRAIKICEGIITLRKQYNIRWFCFSRGDVVNESLYQAMASAGCMQILVGIEHGSRRILDYFNKKIDLDRVKRSITLARRYDIDVVASLILGAPGETMEDIRYTSKFINGLDVDTLEVNKLTIMPGTALWNDMVKQKKLDPDIAWTKVNFIYDINDKTLPTQQLISARARFIKRKFYLRPHYLLKQSIRTLRRVAKMQ